jgi:hypothetical protein
MGLRGCYCQQEDLAERDEAHRKSIVYLTNPKEMYESLKGRYTGRTGRGSMIL